ncbi:MAG: triose-phosphate isomerase [Candidatus Methanofastidiosia archaeon]
MILINFKAYPEACGDKGLRLAELCEEVSRESKKEIAIAPQITELALISKRVSIPVFAQHADAVVPGAKTGHITLESIKPYALGTLINHSERRLRIAEIEFLVKRCRFLDLLSVICTNNLEVSKALASFDPDFIAIEPPELIGSEISVTTADPEIVRGTVGSVKEINPKVKVLCGAGIKTSEDLKKAYELGAFGVLLASGVVKAENPREVLLDLVRY